MLSVQVFGRVGNDRNTAPEYFGLMGVAHGPLRRRHSGKGRAIPERLPVDRSFFVPFCGCTCPCPARRGELVWQSWPPRSVLEPPCRTRSSSPASNLSVNP